MTPPLFSVITPCFNYAHVLGQTLESIRLQSFDAWECLVIDDASTDDTRQVAERYASSDERFRVHTHSVNQGLAAARNTGISQSHGRFLVFLDADDLLTGDALSALAEEIGLQNEDDGTVYCLPWRYFRMQRGRAYAGGLQQIQGVGGDGQMNLLRFSQGNALPVCAGVMARNKVVALGAFDASRRSLEDYEFWMRAVRGGVRFHRVSRGGARSACLIRVHAGTLSRNLTFMYRQEVRLRAAWAESRLFGAVPEAARENERRLLNRCARLALVSLLTASGERRRREAACRVFRENTSAHLRLLLIAHAAAGLLFGTLLAKSLRRRFWARIAEPLAGAKTDSGAGLGRVEEGSE